MKKIIIIINLLVLAINLKAKEPSKYAIGMLLYLDESINIDKVDKSDFIEYMTYKYDFSIKRILPRIIEPQSHGFEFYKIYNENWTGIIAVKDDIGIFRLKGFCHNDFSSFFSYYKYLYTLGKIKVSEKKLIKNLENMKLGIDFNCLYKAHKNFDSYNKEKYDCIERYWDSIIDGTNCFK